MIDDYLGNERNFKIQWKEFYEKKGDPAWATPE